MQRIGLTILSGVSMMALAAPAWAQETPQGSPAVEDAADIIVSARRRDESIQDVPLTVNVVTADQISKLNLRDFNDIQSVVPGLTLTSSSNGFTTGATVRGVAFNVESGAQPTVEFYLNDTVIDSSYLFQSMFDVGQFELLRGPQGTLRGRASPSGSMTVTTRRPDLEEVGMVMEGTATDQKAYKGVVALNVPIIQGKLGIRVAGNIDDNEGNRVHNFRESTYPQYNPDPSQRTNALRVSALAKPTDFINGFFMYQTLERKNRQYDQAVSASLVTGVAQDSTQLIRPSDRLSIQDSGSRSRVRSQLFNWGLDVSLAGQKLVYVGSHNTQNLYVLGPQDPGDYFNPSRFAVEDRVVADPATPAGARQVCTETAGATAYRANTMDYDQCTNSVSSTSTHEVRLQSDERIGGIFDYVVGYFTRKASNTSYLTQETPIVNNLGLQPSLLFVNLTSIVKPGRSKEESFFGNLTAHLGDAFEVSGGLRRIKYRDQSSILVGGAAPAPATDDTYHATIFSASAKYRFSSDVMVYAQVGSSWRPGVHAVGDFSLQRSARENSFIDLKPETSKSYELGLKTSFLNKRRTLTSASIIRISRTTSTAGRASSI